MPVAPSKSSSTYLPQSGTEFRARRGLSVLGSHYSLGTPTTGKPQLKRKGSCPSPYLHAKDKCTVSPKERLQPSTLHLTEDSKAQQESWPALDRRWELQGQHHSMECVHLGCLQHLKQLDSHRRLSQNLLDKQYHQKVQPLFKNSFISFN